MTLLIIGLRRHLTSSPPSPARTGIVGAVSGAGQQAGEAECGLAPSSHPPMVLPPPTLRRLAFKPQTHVLAYDILYMVCSIVYAPPSSQRAEVACCILRLPAARCPLHPLFLPPSPRPVLAKHPFGPPLQWHFLRGPPIEGPSTSAQLIYEPPLGNARFSNGWGPGPMELHRFGWYNQPDKRRPCAEVNQAITNHPTAKVAALRAGHSLDTCRRPHGACDAISRTRGRAVPWIDWPISRPPTTVHEPSLLAFSFS